MFLRYCQASHACVAPSAVGFEMVPSIGFMCRASPPSSSTRAAHAHTGPLVEALWALYEHTMGENVGRWTDFDRCTLAGRRPSGNCWASSLGESLGVVPRAIAVRSPGAPCAVAGRSSGSTWALLVQSVGAPWAVHGRSSCSPWALARRSSCSRCALAGRSPGSPWALPGQSMGAPRAVPRALLGRSLAALRAAPWILNRCAPRGYATWILYPYPRPVMLGCPFWAMLFVAPELDFFRSCGRSKSCLGAPMLSRACEWCLCGICW